MKVKTDVKAGKQTNVAVISQAAGLSIASINVNSLSLAQVNVDKTFVFIY
jgi:hypothetical protein